MRRIFRGRRPSAALVISVIALFVAIGGVAGALPGHNSVRSDDIKNGQVKSPDLKNNDVKGIDVRESSLGTVPKANTANTLAGGVNAADLGPVVVRSENLNDADATANDDNWTAAQGEVDCQPGERAIGGGATLGVFAPLNDTAITRSSFDPTGDGAVANDEGWIIGIVSDQGGAGDKIIQVYCLQQ